VSPTARAVLVIERRGLTHRWPGAIGTVPWARMAGVDAELEAALAPVLADLTGATAFNPRFEDVDWPLEGTVATMLFLPGAGGAGVWIAKGTDRTDQVVRAADQVQQWAVEALWGSGRSPVWPECPEHPDSHPLMPIEQSGAAVWVCPVSHDEIRAIGSFG
jgi:hypothetical protein